MKFINPSLLSGVLLAVLAVPLGAQVPNEMAEEPDTNAVAAPPHRQSHRRSSVRDQVIMGGNLVVPEGQEIKDGVVICGSALIDGKVSGDLVVILGKAKLGAKAEVTRDLTVVGGEADIAPQAKIGGDRVVVGLGPAFHLPGWLGWPSDWVYKGLLWGRPLPHQVLWSWIVAGIFLFLYLVVALLFPGSIRASVQTLANRPGASFLTGLLTFVLLTPLIFILLVTVIGIVVIPFLICGLIAAFIFGKVAVYSYAGEQVGGQFGLELLQKPLVALILGTLIFYLVYTIPVLGFVAWGVIAPFGLGAVLLAFSRRLRSEGSRPAAPEPVTMVAPPFPAAAPGEPPPMGVGQPPVEGGQPVIPPPVLVLPRVGFWLRLGATLIDLVLVGVIVRLLNLHSPAFIFLWTAYHIGLWTWKGTTIGGMVFGIKIVRTNGTPINFAVALVRSLSCFLSAAALFLGFFWAGWSADRQAWHDKIAGTYVVRFPKGVSML